MITIKKIIRENGQRQKGEKTFARFRGFQWRDAYLFRAE
jgi:hypothetical protein